jgi:hypothetical protein
MVVAKAQPTYSDTVRNTAASGTTDTADFDGRAIALAAIDSVSSADPRANGSFSNSFTKVHSPPASAGGEPDGFAGSWVAVKDIAAAATTDTTFSTNSGGSGDQLTCAILVVGRDASGPPPVETVRFYLTNTVSPAVAPGVDVDDESGAATAYVLGAAPSGSATSHQVSESSATNPYIVAQRRWISAPATGSGYIRSNHEFTIGWTENVSGADLQPWIYIGVIDGTTGSVKQVAYNSFRTDLELPLGPGAWNVWRVSLDNDFEIQAGDRIIFQLGWRSVNSNTTTYTSTIRHGGTSGTDLAADDTDYTRSGWAELELAPGMSFVEPTADGPTEVIPISLNAGYPHYAFDIGVAGDSERVLYPPSAIEAGLEFDPEFTVGAESGVSWLQTAVREDAPTTGGTTGPRSEGRGTVEDADANIAWTPQDGGTHWQRFRARVMEHPIVNNVGVATGQIHSLADDIMMVRTRVRSDDTIDLVLREYDPGTDNSVDVLNLVEEYEFGEVYDILFLIHGGKAYVFKDDFTVPVWTTDPDLWPDTDTYLEKWGCYIQGVADWPAETYGRVWYRNVMNWHTGWVAPINYCGLPEVDLGSAGVATTGEEFTRTMGVTGSGVTEHKWTILNGPNSTSGTVLGTAAALSWTPVTPGDYILMGSAKNAQGWANPTFLNVTVSASSGGESGVRVRVTGADDTPVEPKTFTIEMPPETEVGDRLVVMLSHNVARATTTLPGGTEWTKVDEQQQGTSTNHRTAIFTKVADGSDTLTVTADDTAGPQNIAGTWIIWVFAGDAGAPVTAKLGGGDNTSGSVGAISSLDSGNYWDIVALALDSSSTQDWTVTVPAAYAEVDGGTITESYPGTGIDLSAGSWAADIRREGVTSSAAVSLTWSPTEQWLAWHIMVPEATVVATPVEAIIDAPVIITWTPQAVTDDRNIIGHADLVTVTATPQALDPAKAVDISAAVDITVTGQDTAGDKAAVVDDAVDVTVDPRFITFSTGTNADAQDITVEVVEATAAHICNIDPIDIDLTVQDVEYARGVSAGIVDVTVLPRAVEYIVGNIATPLDLVVEVTDVVAGKIYDVEPVDIDLTIEDVDFARQVPAGLVNVSIMRMQTMGYTFDSQHDVTVTPQAVETARAATPMVIGVQVEANAVDAARIIDITPIDITVAPRPASAFTTDTDALNITVEVLAVEAAFSAEATPDSGKIRELPKPQPTRVIAQSILTKEFLHWDLEVHELTISPTLSGATEITGNFPVEIKDYRDLGLEPWGTWIHIEEDGQIRASGILQPTSISKDEELSFVALGVSAYAHGIPYLDEYSEILVDPAQIVRDLWAHMQQYPDADLGVTVTGATTVKLGTEEDPEDKQNSGPYELFWWNGTDIGKEVNSLAKETPFDYIERSEWNSDKTDVLHFIDIGFPRIGTRRYELVFRQDENLLAAIGPEEPDDLFASQVLVLGSGEGRDTVRGYAGRVFGGRVRRVAVVDDKTIQSPNRAHLLANLELERAQALYDVEEITINGRHINAPFGSFLVGDDILIEADVPWIGRVRQWERIISYTYSPDSEEVRLQLRRSESFIYVGLNETGEEEE